MPRPLCSANPRTCAGSHHRDPCRMTATRRSAVRGPVWTWCEDDLGQGKLAKHRRRRAMTTKSRRSGTEGRRRDSRRLRARLSGIARGQSDKIKIGHLTPLTGFLGALGAYAQLGLRMAEEEINKAGGVMGRQLDITSEDFGQSRHRRHQGAAHAGAGRRSRPDGRDQFGLGADHHAGGRAQQAASSCRSARAPTRCAARTATSTRSTSTFPTP